WDVQKHVPPRVDQRRSSCDALGDFHGELEGGGGLEPGNFWGSASRSALDEGGQLPLQRLFALDLDFLPLQTLRGAPVHFAALVLVIEREVNVLLENADLAHLFRTDPSRGDV